MTEYLIEHGPDCTPDDLTEADWEGIQDCTRCGLWESTKGEAMPEHILHDDKEAILQPGCPRCEQKAARGLEGLLELDDSNLELLWRRCLNTEYGGPDVGDDAGQYRNGLERDLGHQLYLVGCLLQGCWAGVWTPATFTAKLRA